jgi:hypothetical protein
VLKLAIQGLRYKRTGILNTDLRPALEVVHTSVLPTAWYLGAGTRPRRASCSKKVLFITVRPPLKTSLVMLQRLPRQPG